MTLFGWPVINYILHYIILSAGYFLMPYQLQRVVNLQGQIKYHNYCLALQLWHKLTSDSSPDMCGSEQQSQSQCDGFQEAVKQCAEVKCVQGLLEHSACNVLEVGEYFKLKRKKTAY
jgi:hypothetical protein